MNENGNSTQTLEMQLKSTGEECLKVIDKLLTSLTGLQKAVDKTTTSLSKIPKATKDIKTVGDNAEIASKKVDKLGTSLKTAFSLTGLYVATKQIVTKAMDFLDAATNRAEELNLFNVIFKNIRKDGEMTFSELGKDAMRFQNQLNEAFGTNMTETLRYQGLFQAMATNQGMSDKYAALMSENMTKLTYDLASLYNKSEKTTAEALRAGVFAGQTKPLRNFGIDVTQTSLTPIIQSLGITDRTISSMSQAEKQALRYIATLRQASAAMGDFADTIESPANQLKIFKQQLVEAKAALGNLFMGLYSEVLPYANAFLMVIKEVAQAIADLFGIDVGDYNTGLADTEEIYSGISDGVGTAAKNAKELNRQILKFDQINNLTTPKSSSSGSGSGSGYGGIDKRIIDALSGYDNLMGKVKMKATEIRDKIMEWLGFTKEINLLTGETSFKFDHITGGTVLGALAVGGTVFVGIKKIYDMVKGIFGLFNKTDSKTLETTVETEVAKQLGKTGAEAGGAKESVSLLSKLVSAVGFTELLGAVGGVILGSAEVYDATERAKAYNTKDYQKSGVANNIEDFNTFMAIMTMNPLAAIFNLNTGNEFIAQLLDSMNNVITAGQIFDDQISEISQKKLTDLINEFLTLDEIIGTYSFTNKIITEDDVTIIKNLMKMIKDTIVAELDADKNEELKNLKPLEKIMDTGDYKSLTDKIKKFYDDQKLTVTDGEKQINEIIAKAKEEGRELQEEDLVKINEIRQKMLDTGVQSMTESEEEYTLIMERLNHNVEALTLERASTVIKNAKSTKEKAIKEAEEQLDGIILQAKRLKDADAITEEEYQKMISAAVAAKDQSIEAAEKQYDEILATVKEKMGENSKYLDFETGEVKKKIELWNSNMEEGITTGFDNFVGGIKTTLSNLGKELLGWTGISTFKKDTESDMNSLKSNMESWKPTIKIPKISWQSNGTKATGVLKTILETLNLPTTLPKLSVQWVNAYANGGFPEDGLFFANHEELVGKFSNGRTAVANNEQIIEGIQSGVYNAVVSAMSQVGNMGGSSEVHLYAHTDEGVVIDRINQKTKQTGVCPINIPSY